MKSIASVLLIALCLSSCVSDRIGSGGWPERTRDPTLNITDTKSYLSEADIKTIHEKVWAENANLRVFSIEVVKPATVLVICTDVPGDRFSRSLGFDMIKNRGNWEFGTYKAKMAPIR
jgi:PBP1b-binding outer membrane lipoprotein LpoB